MVRGRRFVSHGGGALAGVVWVTLLSLLIPAGGGLAGDLLLDRSSTVLPYPLTIQNLMWIVFFLAASELFVRHIAGEREGDQLGLALLPEDERTMLRQKDIGPIYRRVRASDPDRRFWMQRLLSAAMLRFQASGSADQVSAVVTSSMEVYQRETDLHYNLLRYLVWLIPTLGFIGTVTGIALALREAGVLFAGISPDANMAELGPQMMQQLTGQLGVAFYTTLLALLQSAVLMFVMLQVQGREEAALNRVSEYCTNNLVNRLYEPSR